MRGRDILNHMKNKFQNMSACQLISSSTTPVRIHLYEDTKAYLHEILFHSNLEGNINLHKLKVKLCWQITSYKYEYSLLYICLL